MKKSKWKRKIAVLLAAVLMATSAVPISVSAGVGTFLSSKASTIVLTVMERQFNKFLGNYSKTDNPGSSIAGLVYQYRVGPTGMKLGQILEATKQISEQLVEIDQHLTEMEDSILSGIQDIEGILEQQEVTSQYNRLSEIPDLYSRATQSFQKLTEEISKKDGDMNGDGKVNEADIEIVDERYQEVYQMLPDRDFADDMTALAGIISDTEGSVSIEANVTGNHFKNDSTYIKAVKTCTQQAQPFAHLVNMAATYAATYVFQQQADMLSLYAEIMFYLQGQLDEGNLTEAQRLKYQKDYNRLSGNYEAVYNMTINSMNNAAEQIGLQDMMSYLDVEYQDSVSGMKLYQVQMNRAVTEGIEYTTGGIYYLPASTLYAQAQFKEQHVYSEEENSHTSLPIYVTSYYYEPSSALQSLIRKGNPNDSLQQITAPSQAAELFGSYMLNSGASMNAVSYLQMYGLNVGNPYNILFSIGNTRKIDTIKDHPILTYKRDDIYSNELQIIENRDYTRNTEDDDLDTKESRDFYDEMGSFTVLLKNKSEKPDYKISYSANGDIDVSKMLSSAEAGSKVSIKLNGFSVPQYWAQATIKRANGEAVAYDVIESEDGTSDTYEFIMPYQDISIEIKLHENRSNIHKTAAHGTLNVPDSALWGDTVKLGATADIGYRLEGYTVVSESGANIKVTNNKFVMPKEAVNVTASFVTSEAYESGLNGSGTEEDPYQLASIEDWNLLAESVYSGANTTDVYFKVTRILTMEGNPVIMLGTNDHPFDGILLGNNRAITGFSNITGTQDAYVLIGATGENAVICDLTFAGTTLNNKELYNTIIGVNRGSVVNCTSTINTGGIGYGFALENYGLMEDCLFGGNITAKGSGIVGNNFGTLRNCDNNGLGYGLRGGICGTNNGVIEKCDNYADMTGRDKTSESFVAGIASVNEGLIINCSNNADVGSDAVSYVGGLVGLFQKGKIVNSYNLGNVQGKMCVGGLVASMILGSEMVSEEDALSICYNSGAVTGTQGEDGMYIGSLVGLVSNENLFFISEDSEDMSGYVSNLFVNSDNNPNNKRMYGPYDNKDIPETVSKYVSANELKQGNFVNQLNGYVAEYNRLLQSGEIKAMYWMKGHGDAITPVHTEKLPTSSPETGDALQTMLWVFMCGAAMLVLCNVSSPLWKKRQRKG